MNRYINNVKACELLSCNGFGQNGGGSEPPLTHNKVDCAYLPNEMPCQNDNKINCHPEERSELRILPIMEDNKERWSDSEHTKSSQSRKDERFRMTKKCHPGGFPDGRRVNESEPSPGSEQIEHTKTECPYAKLCEREGNPRQLVSGSYKPSDSTPDWSDSEHTQSSQDRNYGRFRMTNNPPQAGVRT